MGGGQYGFLMSAGKDIGFYVGENGMVLPSKFKQWIGVSRRERLMKSVSSPLLKNAINQLYRPGSCIGDGGTASVLKFESRTGHPIGRSQKGHYKKAVEMTRYMENKVLNSQLTPKDRKTATRILRQMQRAILEREGRI